SNYKSSTAKTAGDHRTVKLKLYAMMYPGKKAKIVSLPFNNDDYSTAHPAITADGKTLYFSADKLGGQGGTDLYVATREGGVWAEPKNLGPVINTKYDEKFPFIGYDGTLYYASNALDGLGGLDIYKTKQENGEWSKPENLGAPVNSSRDDFTFIMDSTNKHGYFASNRPNGAGDDDIYHFTYDETKLDYKITVKVVDAVTGQPVPLASVGIDCKTQNPENTLVDKTGERVVTLKGGKPCTIQVMNSGYKSNSKAVSYKDRNTTVTIALKPDVIKLLVTVKEKESLQPIRDAAIYVAPAGMPSINNVTDENGIMQTTVAAGSYVLSSPDYPSIKGEFSEKTADPATGEVKLDFFVPREELIVNVPLTANCFTNTVTVSNLQSGEKSEVSPNANGEVRLDLQVNSRYLIEHDGKADTISTVGLKPGKQIEGPCKFYVGQTWIIRDIYYDLNKWNIRADASKELDNLVRVMKNNPALEIELGSHTDCRASAKYNVVLSARRARSAVEYIVKKGIKSRRILAAGYGESSIINGCICEPTNESNCNDNQHQANRRTEVKVLKY
ncbi:MAG TPA: OmpA family protein, partial [Chitinophagales bacterium]|nr:OmpA family protein [Chitinophagales bacterium]